MDPVHQLLILESFFFLCLTNLVVIMNFEFEYYDLKLLFLLLSRLALQHDCVVTISWKWKYKNLSEVA